MKGLLAALAVLVASGCATVDPYASAPIREHLARTDAVGDCARLFRDVDAAIDRAGVRDAMAPRVPGFPYLRVNRFVESLGEKAAALRKGFAPWSELMARLDRDARAAELGNADDAHLPASAALDSCRYQLAVADEARLPDLRSAAHVPDDYSLTLRTLGLYPLTRLAFAFGIRRWHDETRGLFAAPVPLPAGATLLRYAPEATVQAPPVPRSLAFGLPLRSEAEWRALLLRHAPQVTVETVSDDDRIGALGWREEGGPARARVDTQTPAAYARVAFAWFEGKVVPQLVYTFWFPSRPAQGALDLLSGDLDGLVWRVTLDADFEPLVYDSIHPCGCYHLFFPTERVRARAQPESLDETMFAPRTVRAPRADERIALRVATRTHYLQQVTVEPADRAAPALPYRLLDDNELRRLALPGGDGHTRSVFGPDALVPGSERAERFFFWPMGIASSGQMRQWGRHATAFVGRRHFDDPHLIDRYFERALSDAADAGAAVDHLELGKR